MSKIYNIINFRPLQPTVYANFPKIRKLVSFRKSPVRVHLKKGTEQTTQKNTQKQAGCDWLLPKSQPASEGMGFEPTVELPPHDPSKIAPSTTRTPLYGCINIIYKTYCLVKIIFFNVIITLKKHW